MLGQSSKNKSARSANLYKNFCFVWLLPKVESLYPLDSNPQSKIPPIRSWLIYFSHCFKSCALDTSLRNATLSMTNYPHSVILSLCKRRSIHFGDLRILRDSLTLSESMCLRFTRFATSHTTLKESKCKLKS